MVFHILFPSINVNAISDTTPPTLEKIEISKERVNAGEEVTVYVTAKDDMSGVQYVNIMAKSPSNKQVTNKNIWSPISTKENTLIQ